MFTFCQLSLAGDLTHASFLALLLLKSEVCVLKPEDVDFFFSILKVPNQLLSENKLYSLKSTYNLSALKNLQFRLN